MNNNEGFCRGGGGEITKTIQQSNESREWKTRGTPGEFVKKQSRDFQVSSKCLLAKWKKYIV